MQRRALPEEGFFISPKRGIIEMSGYEIGWLKFKTSGGGR